MEYARWLVARGNVFLPSSAAVAKLIESLRSERWIVDSSSSSSSSAGALTKLGFDDAHAARPTRGRLSQAKKTGGYAVKSVENRFGDAAAAKIAASTEALPSIVDAEWLDAPDREEIRLVWPVAGLEGQAIPVRFPLVPSPEALDRGDVVYTLEIHRAPEYIYPVAKNIGPLPTECACGEDLSFEWDEEEVVVPFEASTGIFAECDECSRTFDPSKGSASITNPLDKTAKEKLPGGAAHRLAVKVVVSRGLALDPKLTFDPALVALVEKEFGRSFYEFATVTESP